MIGASQIRNSPLPHILLHGRAGTGKTTLASLIANEANLEIKYTQGSMFEKKSDLLNIFTNLPENCILFIDEIHSINKSVEELLYTLMEDFAIDVVLGVEQNSKIVRMKVRPFTLIGATTLLQAISKPLKDRFGYISRIKPYTVFHIEQILENSAKKLNILIDNYSCKLIASNSKNTPRIANHLLQRVSDFSVYNDEIINVHLTVKALENLGIYEYGLDEDQIQYLKVFNNRFKNQNLSIDLISGIMNMNKDLLINEIEPLLIEQKLIQKSSFGRKLTLKGKEYLEKNNFNN